MAQELVEGYVKALFSWVYLFNSANRQAPEFRVVEAVEYPFDPRLKRVIHPTDLRRVRSESGIQELVKIVPHWNDDDSVYEKTAKACILMISGKFQEASRIVSALLK